MKMKWFCLAMALVLASTCSVLAQGTAFTYQGRLNDGANPANGFYDVKFGLFDAPSDGSQQGQVITQATVSNGLFTVTVDFGNQFPGEDRWLELGVRTNGQHGDFTTLSPRQQLTSAPYAVQARNALSATAVTGTVAANQLAGTISPANIATGSITSVMLAAGSVTTTALADNAVTLPKLQTAFDGQLARTITDPFNTNVYVPLPPFLQLVDEAGVPHRFGASVAPLQSFLIVGIPGKDFYHFSSGCPIFDCYVLQDAGAVCLFGPDGSAIMGTTLPEGIATNDAQFGFSVAATSTGQILAGAPGTNRAYIINTNGSYVRTLSPPSGAVRFGHAVAGLGNGVVAVSDPDRLGGGSVQVFSTAVSTLGPPSGVSKFGYALATIGGDLLVGAPGGSGGAFLYYILPGGGTFLATTFTNSFHEGRFGNAVAALGLDKVIIGAPGVGRAHLFDVNGTLLATFNNPFPATDPGFGFSVASMGTDKIVIGSESTGRAFLFDTNARLLGVFNNPTPGYAPSCVSTFGNQVAVGFPDSLSVQVFNLDGPDFIPGLSVERGSVTTVSLADGAATGSKLGPDVARLNADSGMTVNGMATFSSSVKISGNNFLEFGAGLAGKEGNAGKIGYQVFTPNSLDIVGAGTDGANRKIYFFAVGGSTFDGPVSATAFTGNGSGLSSLVASNISSGILPDARLSANVPLLSAGKLSDSVLSTNVALRNGPNTFSGNQNFTGSSSIITLDNKVDIYAKNASGQVEGFLTGRWSDNTTYITYGSGGLYIRNNVSVPTMFINSSGNVGIGNFNPNNLLVVGTGGAVCNGTTWINGSDRNTKEEFTPINPQEVLDKVSALPITEWRYKTDGKGIRHLGPMSQDFYDAFKVGADDKHIATVDADGVALAAIQGLNQKVEGGTKRMEQLEAENTELKKRLSEIETLLSKLTKKD